MENIAALEWLAIWTYSIKGNIISAAIPPNLGLNHSNECHLLRPEFIVLASYRAFSLRGREHTPIRNKIEADKISKKVATQLRAYDQE